MVHGRSMANANLSESKTRFLMEFKVGTAKSIKMD